MNVETEAHHKINEGKKDIQNADLFYDVTRRGTVKDTEMKGKEAVIRSLSVPFVHVPSLPLTVSSPYVHDGGRRTKHEDGTRRM